MHPNDRAWFNADVGVAGVEWLRAADEIVHTPYMDWFAGFFDFQLGRFDVTAERMAWAMEGFAALGDEDGVARAQEFRGAVTEDLDEGRALLEAAAHYFTTHARGSASSCPCCFSASTR